MKRLNLLPSELRPRGGNVRHSTYAVLGGLLAATLAMTLYWVVQSGANSTANQIEGLQNETTVAKKDAASLGPYAAFSAMKDARERSVRVVAETRFDYERLTRELTRVLPEGVWIGHLDVAPAPPEQSVVDAGADSTVGAQEPPPAMTVSGCAPSQDVVANTLDRMRALTSATDVELGTSSNSSEKTASSSDRPYVVSGAGASADCAGHGEVAFDATVTLTAPTATQLPQPTATTPTAATTTGTGS